MHLPPPFEDVVAEDAVAPSSSNLVPVTSQKWGICCVPFLFTVTKIKVNDSDGFQPGREIAACFNYKRNWDSFACDDMPIDTARLREIVSLAAKSSPATKKEFELEFGQYYSPAFNQFAKQAHMSWVGPRGGLQWSTDYIVAFVDLYFEFREEFPLMFAVKLNQLAFVQVMHCFCGERWERDEASINNRRRFFEFMQYCLL